MKARLAYVNIIARDIEGLSRVYTDVFGFPEIEGHRSPIYRRLDAGGARDLQDRDVAADLDQICDGTVCGAFEGRSLLGALETLVGSRRFQERWRRSPQHQPRCGEACNGIRGP